MNSDMMILKAVLMLRRVGNKSTTKEEQIAEVKDWVSAGYYEDGDLENWIQSLREELAKTPEQIEEESRIFCEELAEREALAEYEERMSREDDRDEWFDYWNDRARSVGATW